MFPAAPKAKIRALAWVVPLFLIACVPHAPPPQRLGAVETPVEEATVATSAVISGWALDPTGVDRVEVRMDGANHAARYGIARREIGQAHPDYPDSPRPGFEVNVEIDPLARGRHELSIVMVGRDGGETMLGRKSLIAPSAMKLWADRLAAAPALAERRFFFLMAASAIPQGGAKDAERQYAPYYSATMRTGVTVPILYLRTTKGASDDWVFDPDFEPVHRCKDRLVAEDSLNGVIGYAVEKKLPVQFSLNGGVWADSSCDTPEWDVNDHLEQDVANCQWTQDNVVYADDYLKNLTGSIDSPELARVLTYNVYASRVRDYKKRNLQAAARVIVRFAQEHPDLLVGVNLDADTYMNPFFEQKEWFDYNPGTIKQFRHWLGGTGPYAGKGEPGTPDLSAYRRKKPLTLAEVNRIARKRWTLWSAVDPPRVFPGTPHDPLLPGQIQIWDDPWYQEWDVFRKHLVGLHYDELSQWAHDAGIPTDKIYSAQGFMAPGHPMLKPFAVRLDSHGQNYDSAGVSIEGAIPRAGHLGAILYGKSAQNLARMEVPHSLFATFSRMDSGWAVAEFNSTDLQQPNVLPGYGQAYRSFRDFFNYDAKQVTAMAWNGSDGANAGQKGFLAYTAWRNTPAEEAMTDFLVSHANLPRGARLWTFGSPGYADDDGWSAQGARLVAGPGRVELLTDDAAALLSPPDQVIRANEAHSLVVGFIDASAVTYLRVLARQGEAGEWREIAPRARVADLRSDAAGVTVALSWPEDWRSANTIAEQLKLELEFAPAAGSARLAWIAVYPGPGIGDKTARR